VLQRQHPKQLLVHVFFSAYLSESAMLVSQEREEEASRLGVFVLFIER
jgi:hypothetical protein